MQPPLFSNTVMKLYSVLTCSLAQTGPYISYLLANTPLHCLWPRDEAKSLMDVLNSRKAHE